jgi:hypothetical protein
MASSLVVLKFDTPEGADKALEIALGLQKERRTSTASAWAAPLVFRLTRLPVRAGPVTAYIYDWNMLR